MQICPKLTCREIQVLNLISYGYSSKIIADNLFLSIETIKTHRRNLLKKMSAINVAHLIRLAAEQNYLFTLNSISLNTTRKFMHSVS